MRQVQRVARRKKLIIGDEVIFDGANYNSHNNAFKSMVTSTRMVVERKGKDTLSMGTFAAFMLFTNHENPARIEKCDRRHLCLQVANHRINDRPYWAKMVAASKDPAGPPAFLRWLLDTDLTGFEPDVVPMTQMKMGLIVSSMLSSERFLREYLMDRVFQAQLHRDGEAPAWAEPPKPQIQCAVVYQAYTQWCIDNGERHNQANARF